MSARIGGRPLAADVLVLLLLGTPLFAAEKPPIRYTVSFPAPQTHYVEVEARIPTDGRRSVDLMMPVWTPGSYLVREFSRNVESLTARSSSGRPLTLEKTRKNRWRVAANGEREILVSYRVYARQMTVQTNFVGPEFALLNGAATFITRADALDRAHEILLQLPPDWKESVTGLSSLARNQYRAADYDLLVDSPIIAGNPAIHRFDVGGKQNLLVNVGEDQFWDDERAAADVEKIVRENLKTWGSLPYDRYIFFNLIVNAGGGLEHKNSTVIMTRPFAMRTHASYIDWLDLVSHEYFHTWNVKRLRPVALGPFDYENEIYTPDLWISEGFTSYYATLILRRASLITEKEYLEEFSKTIEQLQTTPGRLVQPVDLSSFDTWIRHYRPDENSPNIAISYYTKGAVIGFLLDAQIRDATSDAKSLDEVMRLAYSRYGGERGFTSEQFEQIVAEIGGPPLAQWLHRVTATAEELDYSPVLKWYGLQFGEKKEPKEGQEEPRKEEKGWLGIQTRNDSGRLLITQVRRGTSAYDSALSVEDEIVAVDGFRVTPDGWNTRLEQYRPGDKVTVLVSRRDRLTPIEVILEKEPPKIWKLEADPKASDDQKRHRASWLGETKTKESREEERKAARSPRRWPPSPLPPSSQRESPR